MSNPQNKPKPETESPPRQEETKTNPTPEPEHKPVATAHGPVPSGKIPETISPPTEKPRRGTAAMDPQTRREVARKGGLAVSRNREHMAQIGKKGGQSISRDREHMARIGKKGGETSRTTPRAGPGESSNASQSPQESIQKKTGTESS